MSADRVMIVAGEASGDMHGGRLAESLKKSRPDLEIFGMGGRAMRQAGVETLVDISRVAVVGLWEVLAHFRDIKAAFDAMKKTLRERRPRLLVLIDYPDFNLRLAAEARKAGVPVVYYISPQVWAWRRGRVKRIAGLVRKMLVVFPFEEEFYRRAGVDCRFVGNPLMDSLGENPGREALAARFGLDPARPVLGLLPGSRRKELFFHLPAMMGAWRILKERKHNLQAVIPVADTLSRKDFRPYLSGFPEATLVEGDVNGVMDLMDTAAVASGTATLQTALHGKPMVVIYRLSPLSYLVGRLLIRGLTHIGMVNIVAGEEVVPELIQRAATPENIAARLRAFMDDGELYRRTVSKLAGVRARMGPPGASDTAAGEILRLLESPR